MLRAFRKCGRRGIRRVGFGKARAWMGDLKLRVK